MLERIHYFSQQDIEHLEATGKLPFIGTSYQHDVEKGEPITVYLVRAQVKDTSFYKVGLTKAADPLSRDKKAYKKVLAQKTVLAEHISDKHPQGSITFIEGFALGRCAAVNRAEAWRDELGRSLRSMDWAGCSEAFPALARESDLVDSFYEAIDFAESAIQKHGLSRLSEELHIMYIYATCMDSRDPVLSSQFYWRCFEERYGDSTAWQNLLASMWKGHQKKQITYLWRTTLDTSKKRMSYARKKQCIFMLRHIPTGRKLIEATDDLFQEIGRMATEIKDYKRPKWAVKLEEFTRDYQLVLSDFEVLVLERPKKLNSAKRRWVERINPELNELAA